MQIQGKLIKKFDKVQVSDTFAKREFVIEYADNPLYPQKVILQLTQDRCSLIDNIPEGTELTVHFNLRGREWTAQDGTVKYFNTLESWKIELGELSEIADTDDLPF